MDTNFKVNPLTLIFLLLMRFCFKKTPFYRPKRDWKKFSNKNYESTHPKTRNLRVAEIHTTVSKCLTHPNKHSIKYNVMVVNVLYTN